VRVAQPWAGKGYGAFFLPRIGQEVLVHFIEGDPDQPLVIGSVYNAAQTTPDELPAKMARTTLRSNSTKGGNGFNEMRFDDTKDTEQLFFHAERDLETWVKHDALTRLLRTDPHLGPFLAIPSKDNGFDIEGLAAAPGGRLFLGLRGPVIDGWACVLEILVAEHSRRKAELVLRKLRNGGSSGRRSNRYRKHFLDLGGAGIRDLCLAGRDLLILAGPPMRGEGKAHVHRWKSALAVGKDSMIGQPNLAKLLELPYGETKNHPEGIAIVAQRGHRALLMAIYDSVEKDSRVGDGAMWATLHTLALR